MFSWLKKKQKSAGVLIRKADLGAMLPVPSHFYYVLPGAGIYGGVKKGFHCADLLTDSGYPCTVATPDGTRATWFENHSPVITRDELARRCEPTDAILFSCPADAPYIDSLPAGRKILHMQGANTPGDWKMIDPARGYECISHGLHMTYQLQLRGRVAPYVAMGIPNVFRWQGEPKVPQSIAVMPRKGEAVLRAVQQGMPEANFVMIDGLSETDAAAKLKSADLFLAISENEALGLPPLEAMCAGCCVIGFPGIGGFEFMRHLETAYLIPNGDITGLISGLRWLLTDPIRRDALRQAGMDFSKYYTMERERRYLLRALGLIDRSGGS
jgi:glycosyltransferase involved in cell wall biosynthesis